MMLIFLEKKDGKFWFDFKNFNYWSEYKKN